MTKEARSTDGAALPPPQGIVSRSGQPNRVPY